MDVRMRDCHHIRALSRVIGNAREACRVTTATTGTAAALAAAVAGGRRGLKLCDKCVTAVESEGVPEMVTPPPATEDAPSTPPPGLAADGMDDVSCDIKAITSSPAFDVFGPFPE